MSNVSKKFLKYVSFDTQSLHDQECYPSTAKQLSFANDVLKQECINIGLSDVNVDKYGYVTATLPSNVDKQCPVIAFIAHMDTSPDAPGANVKPQVIENYNGLDINLNNDVILSPSEFSSLKNYVGKTLITTDGTTLLGADNKAGIAEILEAMEYLIAHDEIPHGTIKIVFTPDEEVGHGVDFFDTKKLGAEFGYTVDGGELGELEYETFSAARAKLIFRGKSIHPGNAYKIMKNAALIASEFIEELPKSETPSTTRGREGFFHLTKMSGAVDTAELDIIIRDFETDSFENRKKLIVSITDEINKKYGEGTAILEIKDEYRNMSEVIIQKFEIVELAKRAFEECNITPIITPVRGGTDGSRLSFMGLPTPNIFTGAHNFHGPYEYICVESMEKAVDAIVSISKLNAQ